MWRLSLNNAKLCPISVEFKGWENGANVQQNKKIKAEFDSYMVADKNVGAHIFFFSTGRLFPHLSLGRLHPESSACWRQRSLVSNYPGKRKPKFEKSRDFKGKVQKQTGVL